MMQAMKPASINGNSPMKYAIILCFFAWPAQAIAQDYEAYQYRQDQQQLDYDEHRQLQQAEQARDDADKIQSQQNEIDSLKRQLDSHY